MPRPCACARAHFSRGEDWRRPRPKARGAAGTGPVDSRRGVVPRAQFRPVVRRAQAVRTSRELQRLRVVMVAKVAVSAAARPVLPTLWRPGPGLAARAAALLARLAPLHCCPGRPGTAATPSDHGATYRCRARAAAGGCLVGWGWGGWGAQTGPVAERGPDGSVHRLVTRTIFGVLIRIDETLRLSHNSMGERAGGDAAFCD